MISFPSSQSHYFLSAVQVDRRLASSPCVVSKGATHSSVGDESNAVNVIPVFDDNSGHILTHRNVPGSISALIASKEGTVLNDTAAVLSTVEKSDATDPSANSHDNSAKFIVSKIFRP